MMNFKNRKGFLLLEAVFATFVVGIIMGPLFISQNNILLHLSSGIARLQRFYLAKDFLLQTVIQQANELNAQKNIEKKNEDPAVNMTFTQEPVGPNSALNGIPYLEKAQVNFGWEWANKGFSDSVAVIVFRPPKQDPA
ncbi:hypothetical protein EKK58_01935 [Candidatus Dependentiae bacterium]|nr:MAG: hypothetical protein EKK58_01935 [Candidatus Dependentiae bacterium]